MTSQFAERTLKVNGIDMRITEQGSGPLVIFCHGWPELSYSWRHQLPAVAEAGFHAVAPDMRGYGGTSAPKDIADYTIFHMTGDIVALVAALGETQAIVVGHDWGAPIAWHCAMFRPDVFTAVVGLSVPPRPRGPALPLGMLRAAGLERFYWIYFQEPGVAEAEFEADPVMTFRKLFYPKANNALRGTGGGLNLKDGEGFLSLVEPADTLPDWVSEADIMHFATTFRRTGFRGGLNWYRNIDRNWDLTAPWQGAVISAAGFVHRRYARRGDPRRDRRARPRRNRTHAAERQRQGADRRRRPLGAAGAPGRGQRGDRGVFKSSDKVSTGPRTSQCAFTRLHLDADREVRGPIMP